MVVIIGKLSNKIRDIDDSKLVVGTYMGDLRLENGECYVLLEDGSIWVGLKREVIKHEEQK